MDGSHNGTRRLRWRDNGLCGFDALPRLNWQLKIGARVSLDHFMKDLADFTMRHSHLGVCQQDYPIHVCMYDLPPHENGKSDESPFCNLGLGF